MLPVPITLKYALAKVFVVVKSLRSEISVKFDLILPVVMFVTSFEISGIKSFERAVSRASFVLSYVRVHSAFTSIIDD